ncbi:hypothetical protein [Marinirhabdus gelatinilytica]|uniref:Outer membrane beta-barrel protein n=1 Tax=Marinirhabdus gelatinilytica TaxID=1703343 RepID=A0A370QJZ2_9FLAO|nr:hypothetical protein [Marinirhabdus gelatinilytica]RDK88688.1 hypothetical protein C8D94_101564 [Marinirhabdus gelatinilytica]
MKKLVSCILIFGVALGVFAQDAGKTLQGAVTFVTSNNVYVRFDGTENLNVGDVLTFNGTNCLKITSLSSTSAVCTSINNCEVSKDDTVTATVSTTETTTDDVPIETTDTTEEAPKTTVDVAPEYSEKESLYKENIRGRVSVASYNLSSNVRESRNRLQGRFSLTANHIGDSKFSVESYIAYRSILSPPENYASRTSIFNIYNLNLRYDALPDLSITAGRKINPKASSLGANDGVMVEKYFGKFYVGAIGGFRPDIFDYGFNTDLLQYGGYFGIETDSKDFYSQTTLGAMEQTNAGATDRRYIYFQHNSTIASNLNLFSSMELDIFGGEEGGSRLTNLYLSARYRFSRAVNAMISYDSRKQIIYYQTFQTELERFLDDDLARQGIRLRLNVRPAKIVWLGASYSNRSQSDSQNESNNVYGYATLSKIPGVGGRFNVSYNSNTSRYLSSNIASVRYSRDVVKGKLQADAYFRNAKYEYENRDETFTQNYFGGGLNWSISRSWQFSINGELSTLDSNDEKNYRFYTRLTKRFYSKKKKR